MIYFVRGWYFLERWKYLWIRRNRFRAGWRSKGGRRGYRSTTEGCERALVAMETLAQRVDCGVPQVFYGLDDCRWGRDSKNRYTDLDTRLCSPSREGNEARSLSNFARWNLYRWTNSLLILIFSNRKSSELRFVSVSLGRRRLLWRKSLKGYSFWGGRIREKLDWSVHVWWKKESPYNFKICKIDIYNFLLYSS